jgi:hypothetical protein
MGYTLQIGLEYAYAFLKQSIAIDLIDILLLLFRILFVKVLVYIVVDCFHVAIERVIVLAKCFVKYAQVQPGCIVLVVQLDGANVRLQCVHCLILLLIQNALREKKRLELP